MLNVKYKDTTWDFKNEDIKYLTHCIHNYPAMMIPQIANRLIKKYGDNSNLLFDPYCGTGTSLLEANLIGLNAIGTDINPLARLISKVKSTLLSIEKTSEIIKQFEDAYLLKNFSTDKKVKTKFLPDISNLNFWFTEEVIIDLSILKSFIYSIYDEDIKDFFKVSFSETVRECSLTRNSEFKLYRIPKDKIELYRPDVFIIFFKKITRNFIAMKDLVAIKKNKCYSKIFDFNTVYEIPKNLLKNQLIDIVVTSPPYGDSKTTVAYGQYSKLSSDWLDIRDTNQIDNLIMGGKTKKEINNFGNEKLDKVIKEIESIDIKRAQEVNSFFYDYQNSIQNVSAYMKKGSIAAYVVGNRRVKGIDIPMDEATSYFFERNHFSHIETIIREIPNKRMPSKNSPSNVIGKKDSTMVNEYIVVMKKK